MTREELEPRLAAHRRYLETDGAEGERLSLRGADLRGANLEGANLEGADLTDANLTGADLTGANLTRADLWGANLTGANLTDAYLTDADLTGANLEGANLEGAILTRADLWGANLTGANLTDAYLTDADLTGAYLTGAYLTRADLTDANLTGVIGLPDPKPGLLQQVAQAALTNPDALDMSDWHTCDTTHCIAGWAIHLAGDEGRALEHSHGPQIAGLFLLGAEAHSHFFDTNESARAWLQAKLEGKE